MDPVLMKSLLGGQGLNYTKEKRKPRRVIVFNYKTAEWMEYASAYYFINKHKLSNKVVLGRLNAGLIIPSGNWYYSYFDPGCKEVARSAIFTASMKRALNY